MNESIEFIESNELIISNHVQYVVSSSPVRPRTKVFAVVNRDSIHFDVSMLLSKKSLCSESVVGTPFIQLVSNE
jgi:hypothetical protein